MDLGKRNNQVDFEIDPDRISDLFFFFPSIVLTMVIKTFQTMHLDNIRYLLDQSGSAVTRFIVNKKLRQKN